MFLNKPVLHLIYTKYWPVWYWISYATDKVNEPMQLSHSEPDVEQGHPIHLSAAMTVNNAANISLHTSTDNPQAISYG